MNKLITLGFGVLFGLITLASSVGVIFGFTHQVVIGIMSGIISVFSFREFRAK